MSIDLYVGAAKLYSIVLKLKTGVKVENLVEGTVVYFQSEVFLQVSGNPKECKLLTLFYEIVRKF